MSDKENFYTDYKEIIDMMTLFCTITIEGILRTYET
jgi:hypothetical protein